MRCSILLSLLFAVLDSCYGVQLPFHVQLDSSTPLSKGRRAVPIYNNGNAQYITNITLGGVVVPVMIDTGSSDLWVNFYGTTPSTTDLGKSLSLSYAVGSASGDIHSASLAFDNFTVDNQAFLLVANASSFSTNIHASGYDGLVGLGPNSGSSIQKAIKSDAGESMLTRIFQQDKTSGNYISFLLDRKFDPGDTATGQFSVASVIPGYENITNQPKMDVETVHRILKQEQHWQALTDKDNGIIGPDGQIISVDSIVPKAPDGQLVAVFDSGFTFSQVPRDVSDAIYGRVQGAVYDTTGQYWTVPCGQVLNLTFNFGGQSYPVHPLDVVDDNFDQLDSNGNHVCIGAFQPITSAFSLLGNYDMIMGMSFLRNAYALFDFGDWISDTTNDQGDPYIQLLSTTNPAQAHADFVKVRLGGVDTTGSAQWALLPANETQHSPVSAEEKKEKYEEMILSRWPYIFVGCLVFVILLLGLFVWRCCCRRGGRWSRRKKAYLPSGGKEGASASYLPLQVKGSYGV